MQQRPHVSASQMQVFRQCRLRHRLSQVLPRGEYDTGSMAMLAGTLFHGSMETWLMCPVEQRTLENLEGALTNVAEGHSLEWEHEAYEQARVYVSKFWRAFKSFPQWQPTETEYAFLIPATDRVDIKGYVDGVHIDHEAKVIRIYEIKTHLRKPDPVFVVWGSIQSQCYRFALQYNYPDYHVRSVTYLMVWPQGAMEMTREFNAADAAWDADLRQTVYEMSELPVMAEKTYQCKYCPYFENVCLRAEMLGTDALEILKEAADEEADDQRDKANS